MKLSITLMGEALSIELDSEAVSLPDLPKHPTEEQSERDDEMYARGVAYAEEHWKKVVSERDKVIDSLAARYKDLKESQNDRGATMEELNAKREYDLLKYPDRGVDKGPAATLEALKVRTPKAAEDHRNEYGEAVTPIGSERAATPDQMEAKARVHTPKADRRSYYYNPDSSDIMSRSEDEITTLQKVWRTIDKSLYTSMMGQTRDGRKAEWERMFPKERYVNLGDVPLSTKKQSLDYQGEQQSDD